MKISEKLQAGRLRAAKDRPYLATALWSLLPREHAGLGTLAVDQHWRLYYDPVQVEAWNVEELAAVLVHEVGHLLRDHAGRAQSHGANNHQTWNIAGDAEINDDLIAEGLKLPGSPVTPEAINQPNGRLAEEYYNALTQQQEENENDEQSGSEKSEPQDGSADEQNGNNTGDDAGGDAGQSAESHPGSGSSNNSQDQSKNENSGSQTTGSGSEPDHRSCGSCATGKPEDYEEPAPEQGGEGIRQTEAELIRQQVAKEIQHAAKTRGDVPGGWARWAKERLQSKVNWRKQLSAQVRRAIAQRSGCNDYTYSRPSRRSVPGVVMPAMRQPVPAVAVCVDTSGSMSDTDLSQAVAEVDGIIRKAGITEITALTGDTQAATRQKIRSIKELDLAGGGGTDMGEMIRQAASQKPKPEIIIVITDGHTPWGKKPKGTSVIAAMPEGAPKAENWIKTVTIKNQIS